MHRVALPAGAAGRWCRVRVWAAAPEGWWAKLELSDTARAQTVRQCFLGPMRQRRGGACRETLVHAPFDGDGAVLRLFGWDAALVDVEVAVLSRAGAAIRLLLQGARLLPRAVRGAPAGVVGRVRATLGQAPARAGEAPPYALWVALYDRAPDREALMARIASRPAIGLRVAIVGPDASTSAGAERLRATLASVASSWLAVPPPVVFAGAADLGVLDADWIAFVGVGEVLAPHALAMAADAIQARPSLRMVCADTDTLVGGTRQSPVFKPSPGPVLLPSGLLTTGLCVFPAGRVRRTAEARAGAGANSSESDWRLAVALDELPACAEMCRIPAILTHLPPGLPIAGRTEKSKPVPRNPETWPSITMIVPTAARSRHVMRCLRRVLRDTDYPNFEVLIAFSHTGAISRRVRSRLRRLANLPRTRVLALERAEFNFAEVNNTAATQATGEYLLLLNDDVAPIGTGWLRSMAGSIGGGTEIVGARLLYGNGTVQHGGVIMGLADLCEHSGRFAAPADPGPAGLATLDREVSAVTAACMLVRASTFRELGGLDTAFAIALNDVDFCLRAGQPGRAGRRGSGVALCAQVILYHYESLSLGRHYAGDRAPLEAREVRRLRQAWPAVIHDDPFYNPQASREPGREWEPAFPPINEAQTAGLANG